MDGKGRPSGVGGYRILVTTSRRPSPRVRSFVKDLSATIPGAFRFTRGHYSMEELAREAIIRGADRIVVVGERRGNPGIIRVYAVEGPGRPDNIVSFIVKGVSLSRERRWGLPSLRGDEVLVARPLDSGVAAEFADAFVIAFHARLKPPEAAGYVEAVIESLDSRTVAVTFRYGGARVGPMLRLGKPAEMVKRGGGFKGG
ncbi:Brix domain-containing protein [Aeropyrum pernix]|nr:Brix domain-containing protein [Aeropyrum pernix]